MTANFSMTVRDPRMAAGEPVTAVIPGELVRRVYKTAPVRYENLRAAHFVLGHTERIFAGIREYQEGGWCYTARPEEWCVAPKVTAPFPEGRVFAVYVNSRFVVYEWRAERSDPDDPLSPLGWRDRYRSLVWKRTS